MNSKYNVIIRPVVTERSFDFMEQGKYTFEVAAKAPKEEIANAVERPCREGQHHVGEAEDEARPLCRRQDSHVEEGYRHARRG